MSRVKVKEVNGYNIWLSEGDSTGILLPSISLVLVIAAGIFFVLALNASTTTYVAGKGMVAHVPDLPFGAACVCIAVAIFLMLCIVGGLFHKPSYIVDRDGSNDERTIFIQNDGTDQARVCIAVNAFEREILAEQEKMKEVEKVARGCK